MEWVIVQLSPNGEKELNPDNIAVSVRKKVSKRDIQVYVPCMFIKTRKEVHTRPYIEGYIFVEYRQGVQYNKMRDSYYFKDVMSYESGKKKKLRLVGDDVINKIKDSIKMMEPEKFNVGDEVVVLSGKFTNLRGVVHEVCGTEKVTIFVKLRSKSVYIEYPPSFLKKESIE